MITFITVICVILTVAIIVLVLLQQGKGSDLGSAFGGGSSNSMFGALGPSGFLGKLTYSLVAVWLILSLTLAYLLKTNEGKSEFDDIKNEVQVQQESKDESLETEKEDSDEIPLID